MLFHLEHHHSTGLTSHNLHPLEPQVPCWHLMFQLDSGCINVRSLFLFWFCWLPWFLKGFWFPCCAGFVHSLLM
ncbi:hypothetical protein HanXRQr2_Chr02g0084331 [Helianthus annuus]|uniref:Uncharacterized protein n=1 Tax=Helianthus annuus TaxID=4232 RepID=A0A9K3JRN7_HELAN|nr:hypothetical protein HanXRQr2_Chr02g0084331 [Helianthus annuus]